MNTLQMILLIFLSGLVSVFLYKYIVSRQRLIYDDKINVELIVKGAVYNLILTIIYMFLKLMFIELRVEIYFSEWEILYSLAYSVLVVLGMYRIIFRRVLKSEHYINRFDIVIYSLSIGIGIGISNLIVIGLFEDGIQSLLRTASAIIIPLTYMMVMAYFLVRKIENKSRLKFLYIIYPIIILFLKEYFAIYNSLLGFIGSFSYEFTMYLLFTLLFTNAVRKNARFVFLDEEEQLERFSNEKTLQEKMSYRFDRFMSYGNIAITGLLLFIGFIVIVTVSVILMIETPEVTDGSVTKMLWLSFMRVLDPGNVATDPDSNNAKFVLITTIATILGLGLISTFIGMISGAFSSRIEKLREGNSKILERDHIIFIGFCEDTLKILDNLIKFQKKKDLNIVIVSKLSRKVVEDEISEYGLMTSVSNIVCRSGELSSKNTLMNIGITQASSVVIIGDKKEESLRIAMLVNSILKAERYRDIDIVLMSDMGGMAKQTFGDRMSIYYRQNLEFDALFRALDLKEYLKLYGNLMGAEGDLVISLEEVRKTIGKEFGKIAGGFSYSTVIGLERKGQILLNPDRKTIVEKEDRLILLMDSNTKPDFNGLDKKLSYENHHKALPFVKESVHRLLMIGDKQDKLIEDLSKSKVTTKTVSQSRLYEDIDSVFKSHPPQMVVFTGYADLSDDQNDDLCLECLAYLDALYNRKKHNYVVSAVINSAQDVKFAYEIDYVDLVIENDKCRNVALSLLDKDNMTLKVEEQLLEVGNRVGAVLAADIVGTIDQTVFEVARKCLMKNIILIGYITREGGLMQVDINPNKNESVCFDDDDLLLVIK
ncbi:hypothetical protein EZV73_25775 [Acidaminobacter sp. JC074]|uniref:CASTOR/POLLUX-related putative ion channel n=1 Tax=Acidaminobacter sp. JC074 TaxID=2530199 RepID=UPI001F0E2B72|nr:hypothetical protein [Acidaminobacter sp. JC074]MCH4891013.1 hypothetical protein [Acidaminobacter sp. JC074]